MADHTPGPWTVDDFNADDISRPTRLVGPCVVYADADCETHPVADCSCNHTCRDDFIVQANARLIAAAPDMLAILQKILSGIDRGKLEDQTLLTRDGEQIVTTPLSTRLREIIAKAIGQQT